ncbi:TGB-2 [Cherry twisted leaf associated virus]|uniref:Movement protein TGB2 n=1 Tax=Cherry twisted leaf associated virus TaxID=1424279 RepID=A0A068EUW0_9VIRU|nr:TGB-2 [Cherry twisted leaf associated virus]AID51403.1 TGB-2 [Cherry twisted leaf associated virus]
MSLTPPTDFSRPLLFAAAGISLALLCATFKANYLPTVGDNIHSLPHGGSYRDGTKAVNYNGLNCIERSSISPLYSSHKFLAFCLVCLLSFLIYVFSKCNGRSNRIQHHCLHHHVV